MVVIFIAFFILTGSSFCKSEQSDAKASSLYKDYTDIYLQELAQKEDDCRRSYIHFIGSEENEPCRNIALERFRHTMAYAHQIAHPKVETDVDTYQQIGIKKITDAIDNNLIMGKAAIVAQMCSPTTDVQTIKTIQEKQQFLENNTFIYNEFKDMFARIKSGEHALLDYLDRYNQLNILNTMDTYIAPSKLKPYASAGLIYTYMFLLSPSMNAFLPSDHWGIKKMEQGIAGKHGVIGLCRLILGEKTKAAISTSLCAGAVISAYYLPRDNKYKNTISLASNVGNTGFELYNLYENRTSPKEVAIHQALIDVAQYMRAAESIYMKMQNNNALKECFPTFYTTYEKIRHDDATKLIMNDLLETNTFTGNPSIFSNVSRIALVADRMIQAKNAFIPLMQAMGELDAYVALVNFKQQNSNKIPFMYTQPQDTQLAFVKAKDFVHPGTTENKENTLNIGNNHAESVIITGPNGCGKSSAAEALAANIFTSQIFGFVQAASFEHSLLNTIYYKANTKDTTGKESRFEAEVRIMKEAYKKIKESIQQKQSSLFIIDEPFTATNARGASNSLAKYLQRIHAMIANNLHIIITHHEIHDTLSDYYHVKDGEGKFILHPGKSTYSNAEQLFEEALNEVDRQE